MSSPSARGSSQSSQRSVSFKSILIVLAFIFGTGYLLLNTANHLMGRALLVTLGDEETTYRNAWVSLNGDITAEDLVVYLYEDDADGKDGDIRFAHARLETPGLHWLLFQSFRNIKLFRFDRRKRGSTPHMDRLHLTLTGIESDTGDEPTLGYFGLSGPISGSPFEAEGCEYDSYWQGDEIAAMGLQPGDSTLSFDYRINGDLLHTRVSLETPGVGAAHFEDQETLLDKERNALLLDFVEGEQDWQSMRFEDYGFVAARNDFCAQQSKISVDAFIARHLSSIERLLATMGLGIDRQTRDTYARFARSGGELILDARFGSPVTAEYEDFMEWMGAVISTTTLRIGSGGDSPLTIVALQRFAPQPLKGLDEDVSTWAAIEAERREERWRRERQQAISNPSALTAASTALPQDVASARAPDVEQAAGFVSDGSAVQNVAPSTPAIGPIRNLASQKPVRIGDLDKQALTWQELPAYLGQPLRVWTVQGGARIVELVRINGDRLQVRARLGGGVAQFSIQRTSLRRIETTAQTRRAQGVEKA